MTVVAALTAGLLAAGCGDVTVLDPGAGSAGSSGAGGDGSGGSSSSGGAICTPGETVTCYEGPAGTLGVGACAAGTRACNAQGTEYGPCTGEVLPSLEVCPSAQDEDCNGQTDEDGCTQLNVSQIVAGSFHTCAILNDDRVKCWGVNYDGRLGLGDASHRGDEPDEMGGDLPAVNVGAGKTAVAIAAGWAHTCALLSDGGVKCWGTNDYGQLGLGDTSWRGDEPDEMGDNLPAINLGTGKTAVAIAAGVSHSCALLNDGGVKCWGGGYSGALGLGDTSYRGDDPDEMGDTLPAVSLGAGKKALAIAAGAGHTCALLNDGSVKCWGNNAYGQLGLGDASNRGDEPNEMGDSLPAVSLGTGKEALAIAAAENYTCALLNDGSVKCWGLIASGTLGDAPNEMGDSLPAVSLGTGKEALAITAGADHSCALLNDGSVKCWGKNAYGQLGLGDTNARGDQSSEMGDNLPAVDLGTGKTAVATSAGTFHSCALLSDGTVKCWGSSIYGQLGQGDASYRGSGPDEMGDKLPAVKLFSEVW